MPESRHNERRPNENSFTGPGPNEPGLTGPGGLLPEGLLNETLQEQIRLLAHNQYTPLHLHSRGHLVYPVTGVLSMVTSEGSWIAPPNRVVWVPKGWLHEHRAHGATDMRAVFIADALAAQLPAKPAVLVVTALAREAILALTQGAPRPSAARRRLRKVIIDDVVAAPEQPLHLPEPQDDRLRAALRLVEEDLATPETLTTLGKKVGASERTLSRLFHSETGMSFPQWRTQLRVHRALILLAEGRSVTDTAVACGWANPSAFIDIFTTLVGQTPGRYQRLLATPTSPD